MKNILNSIFRRLPKVDDRGNTNLWHKLIEEESGLWTKAKKRAQKGKRILVATSIGCYDNVNILESSLSAALTLRGANVEIMLCDGLLPCCMATKIDNASSAKLIEMDNTPRCKKCFSKGKALFEPLGIHIHWMSQLVSGEFLQKSEEISLKIPIAEIDNYKYNGMAVGEHAMAGVLRYYARGNLDGEPYAEKLLRRYLKASLLTVFAVQELLRREKYDTAFFHHGIYVPQGIIGEVCRKEGVHVVNWNPSYRNQTFIFSHEDSYHHTMITEPVSEWEGITFTDEMKKTTLDYLKSRWSGSRDWIWFQEKPVEDLTEIVKELGVDFNKPCIGMLTSVMWDAQLHYKANAFQNMLDWVCRTIEYFSRRPDLQLIIRVHPAEVRGLVPSRQKMVDEINRTFDKIPENIFIIPPESHISTYAIMEKCDSVIIYNTKTGIELSSMGIPVIVAGEAWIRNKGFSMDVSSPEEYYQVLDKLPLNEGMKKETIERARKYAYHFFFRRMIELPYVNSPKKFKFVLELKSLRELLQGECPGLDRVCDGILNNRSFII